MVPVVYLIPMLLAENTHAKVLTPYALDIIKSTSIFFVENLKTTRRFFTSLKIGIVIDDLQFIEINQDTKFEPLFEIMQGLEGKAAGIISEAGCSGVADPGALVVEIAHQLGSRVEPLVGPNSILLALMASGFSGQSFVFHGYLPIKEPEREKKIKFMEREALAKKQTQIFMETPYRNTQILAALLKVLMPSTRLCVACDITSADELIVSKSIQGWRSSALPDFHKKPCIFLIY
jgi:16S rRNA (cytidine1402-2'-O)-methyltransferase